MSRQRRNSRTATHTWRHDAHCHWRADIGRLFVDSKLSLPGRGWDGVALAFAIRALAGVLLHSALALLLRWPRRASALRVRIISSASYTERSRRPLEPQYMRKPGLCVKV